MKLEQVAHSTVSHLQGAEVVMDSECCPMLPTLMRHVFMEIHVLNNMQVHTQQVSSAALSHESSCTLGRKALPPLFKGALDACPCWAGRRNCCASVAVLARAMLDNMEGCAQQIRRAVLPLIRRACAPLPSLPESIAARSAVLASGLVTNHF